MALKIIVLLFLTILPVGLISCSEKKTATNAHDGVYQAYETTEIGTTVENSGRALPLLNYQLILVDGQAKMIDLSDGTLLFQGPFNVTPSPRSSPMKGSEQINVTVSDEVFKPSIYTHGGKMFYLDLDGKGKSLTILTKKSNP